MNLQHIVMEKHNSSKSEVVCVGGGGLLFDLIDLFKHLINI